ncbi:MAG: EAL domain-containing protein [Rhodocyclaceae bacterium]|nr:EAL domain-containing protein [Rhodocyclaceae bacterium]
MAKILVVDDRLTNRQYLMTLLGYYGHELFEAANGAEALDVVRAVKPDLVITDILMPTMDGYQFALQLRADAAGPQPRLIFYTATYSAPAAQDMAASCGVDAVLMKPCDPADLLATVNRLLGIAEKTAAVAAAAPEAAGAPALPADYNLTKYITKLQMTKRGFDDIVVRNLKTVLERELADLLADEFSEDIADLRRLLFRLTVLIEVSTETAAERDPARLVEIFFGAACEVINSHYAAIAMFDEHDRTLRHLYSKDVPVGPLQRNPLHGALGALAAGQRALRWDGVAARANIGELPPGHPAVANLLGVAIAARGQTYGWLYFADKHGDQAFSEEDERFAAILVEKLALMYENVMFYDLIQRHAAQLQVESTQRAAAEVRLRESEQRFRQLAENVRDVFFLDSIAGETLYVNPAYEDIWGRSRDSLYAAPWSWTEPIHDDDKDAAVARFQKALRTSGEFDFEFRIVRQDGQLRWIRARGFPARNEAGEIFRVAGIFEDVSERKEQEEKIARLSRIQRVLSGINSAIVRIHERGALFQEACRIAVEFGQFALASIAVLDPETGALATLTMHGEDAEVFSAMRDRPGEDMGTTGEALRTGKPSFCNDLALEPRLSELRAEMLEHGYRSVISLPLLLDGAVTGMIELCSRDADFFDADELPLLEELAGDVSFALAFIAKTEKLDYLAYYDALTGLPNSTLFHDRLSQLVLGAAPETEKIAVIVVDLDRFAEINDRLGRHAGDILLKLVAKRLDQALTEPITVARIGANTFAAAVGGLQRGADAVSILQERIFEPLARPFDVSGIDMQLSARAGIALFPDDGGDAHTLFKHAESALKQTKASGAARFLYYSAEANARIAARLALEQQMREAIRAQQFVLHYQPRVDLASGLIVGAEALIRWQHPERGLLEPDEFIPLAEQNGLIEAIGDWVIDSVCAQQVAWLARYGATVPVAFNLSAVQIGKADFLTTLQQALAGRDLDKKYLEVELTESAVMENLDDAMRTLSALRALGIALSLDDFGTGYSSLAYLKRFPFNFVKIDKSFIADIVHNPEDAVIAKAIIALAHRLNLRVVAEGVETEAQLTYLRANGCDEIQGFYFSRAVPSALFGEMLRTGKRLEFAPVAEPGAARTVLVVDADAAAITTLKRLLQTEGCDVLTAESGEQALDVMSVNAVQVIVCDQRMPGMSGTQFCGRVKSLYPETVRIVLSGYPDIEAVVDAVNKGVIYRFLTKPLDDRLLKTHVRDAFRHYSSAESGEAFLDSVA